MVKNIMKRDGRVKEFDISKIESAISKAMNAVGDREFKIAAKLARTVEEEIDKQFVGSRHCRKSADEKRT